MVKPTEEYLVVERDTTEKIAYNIYDEAKDEYLIFDKDDNLLGTVSTAKEAVEAVNYFNDPENVWWWRVVCWLYPFTSP